MASWQQSCAAECGPRFIPYLPLLARRGLRLARDSPAMEARHGDDSFVAEFSRLSEQRIPEKQKAASAILAENENYVRAARFGALGSTPSRCRRLRWSLR